MIHQIYCTHCTHGSSALERREGDLASRIFGYSARAGSLEADELRSCYRQIEPYVYYFLPGDTPVERKLLLTAATAPKRLFFVPDAGGMQLIGQVCYRSTDTDGRPGSYFAHVLLRQGQDGPRWSAVDCLRLWAAPGWRTEDSNRISFLLPKLESTVTLESPSPAVSDEVLRSFLCEPADSSAFHDPGNVVPTRWRKMEPAERRAWFTEALAGLMQVSPARHESLLLVAEPSVAALMFYGLARLLPGGPIRSALSVSTFEPQSDRISTTLAATWFDDPQANTRRPDLGHVRGRVVNTLLDVRGLKPRPAAGYAPAMVRLLAECGWQKADERLAMFAAAGAERFEDLESLAAVEDTLPRLLAGKAPPEPNPSPMAAAYFRAAILERLAGMDDPAKQLAAVVGTPAHLAVLQAAVAESGQPGARAAAELLLGSLPAEFIAELLRMESMPRSAKVFALGRYASSHAELPPGCDFLWDSEEGMSVLADLFSRLDARILEAFAARIAPQRLVAFVAALRQVCRQQTAKQTALSTVVQTLDDMVLAALFRSEGAAFFEDWPADEPAMTARLGDLLRRLPERADGFAERLDLLVAAQHLLPGEDQRAVVTAWDDCRRAMTEVDQWHNPKISIGGRPPVDRLVSSVRRMAEAAARAMPRGSFSDDAFGSRKRQTLEQLGPEILGGRKLLEPGTWQHDELWRRIGWYFETGRWPTAALAKPGEEPWYRRLPPLGRTIQIGVAAIACLVTLVAIWMIVRTIREPRPATSPKQVATAAAPKRPPPPALEKINPPVQPEPQPRVVPPEPELEPLEKQPDQIKPNQVKPNQPPPEDPRIPPPPDEPPGKEQPVEPRQPPEEDPPPPDRGAFNRLMGQKDAEPKTADMVEEDPAALKTAPPDDGPVPKPKRDAVERPRPTEELPDITGRLSSQPRTGGVRPGTIARIDRVTVRDERRMPLRDRWLQSLVVEYGVESQRANGRPLKEFSRSDKGVELLEGTTGVMLQIVFYTRLDDLLQTQGQAVAATRWFPVELLGKRSQYTVYFDLDAEGLQKLRELAGANE